MSIVRSKKDLNPLFKLRNLVLENQENQEKLFLGRVLTIIDASIADPQQRKGLKDIIKDAFYNNGWKGETKMILYSFAETFATEALPDKDEKEAYFGRENPSTVLDSSPGYFEEYN